MSGSSKIMQKSMGPHTALCSVHPYVRMSIQLSIQCFRIIRNRKPVETSSSKLKTICLLYALMTICFQIFYKIL